MSTTAACEDKEILKNSNAGQRFMDARVSGCNL